MKSGAVLFRLGVMDLILSTAISPLAWFRTRAYWLSGVMVRNEGSFPTETTATVLWVTMSSTLTSLREGLATKR